MSKKIIKNFTIIGIIICIAISLVTYLWQYPLILIISLCLCALLKNRLVPIRHELTMFIILGILGPLTESLMMHAGPWAYTTPQLFNFPIWLPFLWGLAGNLGISIYKQLG